MTESTKARARKKPVGRPPTSAIPRDLAVVERRLTALRLRETGHNYDEIGRRLDPPCARGQAYKLVAAAVAALMAETAELADHARAMELARLDRLFVPHFAAACRGDIRATEVVLKIMERQAKFLGLDAPVKQELGGAGGAALPYIRIERIIVDPRCPDSEVLAPALQTAQGQHPRNPAGKPR